MKALVATLLIALPAAAYIPSVGSLLRRSAARVEEGSRAKEAALRGTVQLGEAPPVPATLTLRFPLSCKLDAGAASASARGAPGAQKLDGNASTKELLRLACPLLAYRGQSTSDADRTIRAAGAQAGMNEFVPTSLTRLYDRAAIVLGAGPRQIDRPQLWLYKDTAAPARLVARQGNALLDLRLLQYGNPAAADWFPRVVELWRGDQLVARFEALETKGFRAVSENGEDDEE